MEYKMSISGNVGNYDVKINDKNMHELGILLTRIEIDITTEDVPRAILHIALPNGIEFENDKIEIETICYNDDKTQ